jgi:hypothetical protein
MSIASIKASQRSNAPEIFISGDLTPSLSNLIALSKPYNTIILLFEDDFSNSIQAAWAETDRITFKTRKIGEIFAGIEVHAFGLDDFPPGTVIELCLRESSRDLNRQDTRRCAYKSLMNELVLISVRVRRGMS